MDALAAGVSHRDSLHGDLLFGDQTAVDEHVASYEMPKREPKVSFYHLIDVCRWERMYLDPPSTPTIRAIIHILYINDHKIHPCFIGNFFPFSDCVVIT